MRTTVLGLALLSACADGGSLQIKKDDDVAVQDTDAGTTGGDTDTTGGGGGDTDGTIDTDPTGGGGGGDTDTDGTPTKLDPFPPDPLVWSGTRHFAFTYPGSNHCELDVDESGEQVYGVGYLQITNSCAGCQRVFEVSVDASDWCYPLGNTDGPVYRGLKFLGGGVVEVYSISKTGARWGSDLLATGSLVGNEVTYHYDERQIGYSYAVDGKTALE